jgi:uncharacterized repeat protein (TIGR03803 family)
MLYGTTSGGGRSSGGTIFQYNTSTKAESLLHSFAGGPSDGNEPYGSLVLANNVLYGMTAQGGGANDGGDGTIFQYNLTNNSESIAHSFTGGSSDGSTPYGSLAYSNGDLYGLTELGGAHGKGVIFQYNLSTAKLTILHSFAGGADDGENPQGSLLLLDNVLYGMTFGGGSDDDGVIFGCNLLNDDYSVLHTFTSSTSDGANPTWGSLIATGNTLYGLTPYGGKADMGVVFSLEVPEPGSFILLAAGCGLTLIRRRSKCAGHQS